MVRVNMDASIALLDEEDFAAHGISIGYPDGLVTRALAARIEVLAGLAGGASPFDRARQAQC